MRPHRILLLTDLLPPQFAPRITALLQRLPERDWQVDVVSEEIRGDHLGSHGSVERLSSLPAHRLERVPLAPTRGRSLYALADALWQVKSRRFVRHLRRHYDLTQYALIVGMSYRTFPLPAVARLARQTGLPAVMDCRDIVEEYTPEGFLPAPLPRWLPLRKEAYRWLRRQFIKARTRALRAASAITTVSEWHRDQLQQLHPDQQVFCIPNGYDERLFVASPEVSPQLPLRIVYTGRLLSLEMRDPTLLLEALQESALSRWVRRGAVEVHWYCDNASQQLLESLLERYSGEVRACQHFHAMVPYAEVPTLLAQADMLLLLGRREQPEGPHGMVTTKLFEAMAMHRPILMVESDESVVAQILRAHAGSLAATDVAQVVQFVTEHLERLERGEVLPVDTFTDHYQQYTRAAMAEAFAQLFGTLV